ncbi:MAG: PEP-CTERM sorting domain-containing protein [Oceanipulchritudo sp.]
MKIRTYTLALCALLLASPLSAVIVIEDFEAATPGADIGTLTGWTENTAANLTMDIAADPADALNQVLRVNVSGAIGSGQSGAWRTTGTSIATSSTAATLFFQIRFENDTVNDRAFAGLSAASEAQLAASTDFDQAAAYAGGITSGGGFGARDGGTTLSTGNPAADTWYNIWLVVNNSTETYDVYINSGAVAATAGDLIWDDNEFRTGADGIPGPLDKLIVLATGSSTGVTYLDNFILDDSAANLNYQLVPEPSAWALILGVAGGLMLLRRRR